MGKYASQRVNNEYRLSLLETVVAQCTTAKQQLLMWNLMHVHTDLGEPQSRKHKVYAINGEHFQGNLCA